MDQVLDPIAPLFDLVDHAVVVDRRSHLSRGFVLRLVAFKFSEIDLVDVDAHSRRFVRTRVLSNSVFPLGSVRILFCRFELFAHA